ncbi:MAG: selenocysteine-specific translation elongation factor [Phycisphaerae bacterium]|nr:selenocysteine-specific translation elongation factor [Phycisphaerae bacterium]
MKPNRQLILGTAGHIDHGKTALVLGLTGVDTDRLPQEKERGITIDIGFAQLQAGPFDLGIVDVPGHERFIRNMLAGASGIDLALLVIAADDGIMPQTREHLAILRLLDIRHGLIALTKSDLVEADWLDLVESDIRQFVAGTFLESAPLVRTSASTGAGLAELRQAITGVCETIGRDEARWPFRMAIDRSFVMPGLGAVVTGTVWSGSLSAGEEVEWLPAQKKLRVRSLQSHGRPVEQVTRGQRAAIDLMGVHHTDLRRGHELAVPGYLRPSRLLGVELEVLASSPWPLRHRGRVRLHLGTEQVMATVTLLTGSAVPAGGRAQAQLRCDTPVVAINGQPFVIRMESPVVTIGGGHVLQPVARPIGRRDHRSAAWLEQLAGSNEGDRAQAAIALYATEPWQAADLCRDAHIPLGTETRILLELASTGCLIEVPFAHRPSVQLHRDVGEALEARLSQALKRRHEAAPLERTVARSALARSLADIEPRLVDGLLNRMIEQGILVGDEKSVGLAEAGTRLTENQEQSIHRIIDRFDHGAFSPPSADDLAAELSCSPAETRLLLDWCVAQGQLVHIGGGLYLHRDHYASLKDRLVQTLADGPGITLAQLRDLMGTSRKFAQPIGEHLDRVGFTRRRGDLRILAAGQDRARASKLEQVESSRDE